ncbi:MAG: hypothetical protein U1D30_12425 [Planctomycetota bacterium]
MPRKALLGYWILCSVVLFVAVVEGGVFIASLKYGQPHRAQLGRVLLSGWLLWHVWQGANWARWILAALFLAAAGLVVAVVPGSPRLEGKPLFTILATGFGVLCFLASFALASPWFSAYRQLRTSENTDCVEAASSDTP